MFSGILNDHLACMKLLVNMESDIQRAGGILLEGLQGGHKILVCGNGGSAADSQHFAAELIGRFEMERNAWPAIALTTDTSILTALANDYAFSNIFARQVEGLGREGDVLVGISTSGNSDNVLQAVHAASALGMKSIGLLGKDGGCLKDAIDVPVIIPANVTARIQEAHIFILHYWASFIETNMK